MNHIKHNEMILGITMRGVQIARVKICMSRVYSRNANMLDIN